jgi:triacylglycerol esterase/lipase EstA (alpha/beta hydrolase family)
MTVGFMTTGINNFPAAMAASQITPDADPPGANDWSCTPSAAHPRPVILIHGTMENAYGNWNALSPRLKDAGYCVFAINFGAPAGKPNKGTGDIPASAGELATFVDRVLAATGASSVDLVGHSQGGGPMPRWYLKFEGGANPADPAANKVHSLIGIAPSNHGTTAMGIGIMVQEMQLYGAVADLRSPATSQQIIGSSFNATLDAGGDTMPGVDYTVIVSRYDEIVTPYNRPFLTAGAGATVTNITLQDECELDLSDHFGISYSPIVMQLVLNALDEPTAKTPDCIPVPPVFT